MLSNICVWLIRLSGVRVSHDILTTFVAWLEFCKSSSPKMNNSFFVVKLTNGSVISARAIIHCLKNPVIPRKDHIPFMACGSGIPWIALIMLSCAWIL